MKVKLFSYHQVDSFIHNLSGSSKLIAFLLLTTTVMLTFDIRIILVVFILSLIAFKSSKIQFKQIKLMVIYVLTFIVLNILLSYLFAPQYGVEIYGSKTVLFQFTPHYVVTLQELFYLFTQSMKYISVIPIGMIFFLTTDPSEFASALNKIGLPYKGCYALSLTLRYFPDIERSYHEIKTANEARGIEMSKKAKVLDRVKRTSSILVPLILSSMDKVESISNAMDLRGFGQHKRRTWISEKKYQRNDWLVLIVSGLILGISILISVCVNRSRFYNPFI